jgi:hypothetical protein
MTNLTCAQEGCTRRAMRTREGARYCFFCPDIAPPPLIALGAVDAPRRDVRPQRRIRHIGTMP